jgi:hypothetical protein
MPISIFTTTELIGACHELILELNENTAIWYMQKSYLMFFLETYVAM